VVLRAADGKALALGETRWAFVDLGSGRAVDVPQIVAGAYEVVAADDVRLECLGPARRLLQRYD
jgi:acyl-CoA thioesterase FadM